jgi:hypothetical protein
MIHTFMIFFWQKTIRNLGIWKRKKGLEEEEVVKLYLIPIIKESANN